MHRHDVDLSEPAYHAETVDDPGASREIASEFVNGGNDRSPGDIHVRERLQIM
jgi:hypothetical protein